MADVAMFLDLLRKSILEEQEKLKRLRELEDDLNKVDPLYGKHMEDDRARSAEELKRCREGMLGLINILLRVPPWHARHKPSLEDFFRGGDYDSSVFIMTKFPEGNTAADKQLQHIIEHVSSELVSMKLIPRIASGARYHDWLWDEVEIHLLGCSRGIAIVEDRYRPELNPNVAIEWGWMRGMGKRVLYLQEKNFAHKRADFDGLRSWQFDWDNPDDDITAALKKWFTPS